jgi:hypothetical protein
MKDRYAAVRQEVIDAEYVVEERVENYTTATTDQDEKSSNEVRDIGQNGFLGNVNHALEGVARDRGDDQEDEWEDVDT